jgi:hypothetical protein
MERCEDPAGSHIWEAGETAVTTADGKRWEEPGKAERYIVDVMSMTMQLVDFHKGVIPIYL